MQVVCPGLGGWGVPRSEKSTEGIPGTVSPQGHLGPRASDSQTSVPVPPLPRQVPGLLWSGTMASKAAGSTCAMGQGWCSLKTTALACLTTNSSTNAWLTLLASEADTKHSSSWEIC